jgi:hypothetical protein
VAGRQFDDCLYHCMSSADINCHNFTPPLLHKFLTKPIYGKQNSPWAFQLTHGLRRDRYEGKVATDTLVSVARIYYSGFSRSEPVCWSHLLFNVNVCPSAFDGGFLLLNQLEHTMHTTYTSLEYLPTYSSILCI